MPYVSLMYADLKNFTSRHDKFDSTLDISILYLLANSYTCITKLPLPTLFSINFSADMNQPVLQKSIIN